MKEKKSYNLLTTVWLWVVLIGIMPVLGRNLLVSLQFGVGAPADLQLPYFLMILGGIGAMLGVGGSALVVKRWVKAMRIEPAATSP